MLTAEVIEENIQPVALAVKFLFRLFAQRYLQTKYKLFESLWESFWIQTWLKLNGLNVAPVSVETIGVLYIVWSLLLAVSF